MNRTCLFRENITTISIDRVIMLDKNLGAATGRRTALAYLVVDALP
jgi:hypothetical protein